MIDATEAASGPAQQVAAMAAALAALPDGADDRDRIDCIRQLEVLRGAVAAAQALVTAAFVRSQRADQRARGVPASRVGRGIAAQVALARQISPHQAERWVGFSMIAPQELPDTFAALQAGTTSEWRATIVARETAWLSRDDRAEVDRIVAPRLAELGDRTTADEAKKTAYTLDPHGYVDHLAKAAADRHVSVRPAPDVMTRLSALLPVAQGVGVLASLGRAADSAKASGDLRNRGQIMADTLVERCTGLATASDVGVEVQIVLPADAVFAGIVGAAEDITDQTYRAAARKKARSASRPAAEPADPTRTSEPELVELATVAAEVATVLQKRGRSDPFSLDDARSRRERRRRRARDRRDEPALLLGYGPVPAAVARRLIFDRSAHAPTWLRRVYECPDTGQLVAMEKRRRTFTAAQRAFITSRDQYCRTPHCGAPIRHADHVDPWATSRRTRLDDGDGTCEACNYAKQAPGWRARTIGGGPAPDIEITTPTGHTYVSRAPTVRVLAPDDRVAVELEHASA